MQRYRYHIHNSHSSPTPSSNLWFSTAAFARRKDYIHRVGTISGHSAERPHLLIRIGRNITCAFHRPLPHLLERAHRDLHQAATLREIIRRRCLFLASVGSVKRLDGIVVVARLVVAIDGVENDLLQRQTAELLAVQGVELPRQTEGTHTYFGVGLCHALGSDGGEP